MQREKKLEGKRQKRQSKEGKKGKVKRVSERREVRVGDQEKETF